MKLSAAAASDTSAGSGSDSATSSIAGAAAGPSSARAFRAPFTRLESAAGSWSVAWMTGSAWGPSFRTYSDAAAASDGLWL